MFLRQNILPGYRPAVRKSLLRHIGIKGGLAASCINFCKSGSPADAGLPLRLSVLIVLLHPLQDKHCITDAHAKRDFRIFCIVIHRFLHTSQMQGAAVKTAAPHSAIFLMLSGVGRFWLLPYFGTEHQVIVHRLMKLFLQALRILRLEVHHIVDAEDGAFRRRLRPRRGIRPLPNTPCTSSPPAS